MPGRRHVRPLLPIATVVTLVVAAAAFPLPRADADPAPVLIAGEATIHPVESNLASKPWVSVRVSSGDASADAARDGDEGTAWRPAGGGDGATEWLMLDLGGTYENLRKIEVVFPQGRAAYEYQVEVASDGDDWVRIDDLLAESRPARGAVHLFTRPGTRYVRLGFTGGAPQSPPGITELRVLNYLRDDLVLGADLSNIDNFRDRNYYVNPNPALENMGAGPHLLDVVKDRGMQFIRLRIFNDPRDERSGEPRNPPTQGPERSLESARWVKDRDLQLGVDFHYADSWADPGKQPKPRAWAQLEFEELVSALYTYTHDYLRALTEQGTTPDKVAIGNEIINGFLWGSESVELIEAAGGEAPVNPPYFRDQAELYQSTPGGRILWEYWHSEDPEERRKYDESWDRFASLVAAGIAATREASPTSRVELHTIVGLTQDQRPALEKTMEFWDQLLTRVNARGQDPDVLAISYYPEWHGTVEQLDINLHAIATAHPEYDLNIAETAYPASGDTPQSNSIFPRTVQGQADAIQRVFQAANDVIDSRGVGVLLWEPASYQSMFRPVAGMENFFEPLASIDVFNRSHARHVLESPVYITGSRGSPLPLPTTLRALRTSDGTFEQVPVQWDLLQEEQGEGSSLRRIHGTTRVGEATAIIDLVDP